MNLCNAFRKEKLPKRISKRQFPETNFEKEKIEIWNFEIFKHNFETKKLKHEILK